MNYRAKDIVCVRIKNGKFVPFVFNKSGSKIKNLFTGEVFDLNFETGSVYNRKKNNEIVKIDRWIYNIQAVENAFSEIFTASKICGLDSLYYCASFSDLYKFMHKKLILKIMCGCEISADLNPDNYMLDELEINKFVKYVNNGLKLKNIEYERDELKLFSKKQETEQSQSF